MRDEPLRPTTLAQASRALGLPTAWLREEADAGRIPCLRAGERYLFDLDVVRSIIMERARLDRSGKSWPLNVEGTNACPDSQGG